MRLNLRDSKAAWSKIVSASSLNFRQQKSASELINGYIFACRTIKTLSQIRTVKKYSFLSLRIHCINFNLLEIKVSFLGKGRKKLTHRKTTVFWNASQGKKTKKTTFSSCKFDTTVVYSFHLMWDSSPIKLSFSPIFTLSYTDLYIGRSTWLNTTHRNEQKFGCKYRDYRLFNLLFPVLGTGRQWNLLFDSFVYFRTIFLLSEGVGGGENI